MNEITLKMDKSTAMALEMLLYDVFNSRKIPDRGSEQERRLNQVRPLHNRLQWEISQCP